MNSLQKSALRAKNLAHAQRAATDDTTLHLRLDDDHQQMVTELCQHQDRKTSDMVRKLIRDAHAKMLAEREEKKR
jgi:hypothetical protein